MASKHKNILLLQGGRSSEREVSLRTGAAIQKALTSLGYEVQAFDPKTEGFAKLMTQKPDAVFIAMHGKDGEDGKIQGLLECAQIPYTSSGVLSSAMCFDKVATKVFLKNFGVLTPEYLTYAPTQSADDWIEAQNITYPVIVKPSKEGSTVGMSIVREGSHMKLALENAVRYCDEVLVESFITGKEITVGILNGKALPIIEIAPKSGFYDYESKYTPGKTEYILPARITPELAKQVSAQSENIYSWLNCRGAARLDYIIDGNSNAYFLEINTIPGMTETSLLPKAAKAAGIEFAQLCEEILNTASLDD